MTWTQTKAVRLVGLSVAGAVAAGTALSGGPGAVTSASSLQQHTIMTRAAGSAQSIQGNSITIRVGANTAVSNVTSSVAEKKMGIGPIIRKIISVLGKSLSWLRDQVVRGYSWFVANVWNKIPTAIRWIIQVGWTVYEIFKEIYNYFF